MYVRVYMIYRYGASAQEREREREREIGVHALVYVICTSSRAPREVVDEIQMLGLSSLHRSPRDNLL